MSLEIGNVGAGGIGRMVARRNLPEIYGRNRSPASVDGAAPAAVDRVDLSADAPRPVSARAFAEAMTAAKSLSSGGRLSEEQQEALREDTVFRAMSVLIAMGGDGDGLVKGWPGGLPMPTRPELEAAYRRIAQRLDDPGNVDNADQINRERAEFMERSRKIGFPGLTERAVSAFAS